MVQVLQFIAMATPEDIKANAAFIHLADEFVQVPGDLNDLNERVNICVFIGFIEIIEIAEN